MAAQTYQLSPATPIGVAIGTDISPIHPAAIAAVRLGAEVAGGIDGTATASGKDHAGRRRTWSLRLRIDAVIAELAFWLVGITGEGFGFTLTPCRFRPRRRHLAAVPTPMGQENQ